MTYVYFDDMFPHLLCSCIVMLPVRTDARDHAAFSSTLYLFVMGFVEGNKGDNASYIACLPLPHILCTGKEPVGPRVE